MVIYSELFYYIKLNVYYIEFNWRQRFLSSKAYPKVPSNLSKITVLQYFLIVFHKASWPQGVT